RNRSRILNRGAAVALYAIAIAQSKRIDFESQIYCSLARPEETRRPCRQSCGCFGTGSTLRKKRGASITKTKRPQSANPPQMPRAPRCKLRRRGRGCANLLFVRPRGIDPSLQPPCGPAIAGK